jgi:WW domain-containing oxidoreductase
MFALEAHKRWNAKSNLRFIAVHPGNMVSSSLSRNWWIYRLLFAVVRPFSKSLQQAASPAVFAAAAPEMGTASGIYVNNCFPCQPSDVALDEHLRKTLWNVSEQIVRQRLEARVGGIKSLCEI